MVNLGTGFLYSFGNGVSGENFIPSELTGLSFSGLSAGDDISSAIYPHLRQTVSNANLNINISGRNNVKFGFGLYVPNTQSPISKIGFVSSFSGSGSGGFVSGTPFQRSLLIVTKPEDPGISIDRGVINLGSTLGTGSGIYKYPFNTFVSSKKNSFSYLTSNSWLEFSGIFNSYNITGFSSGDGGFVIKDMGLILDSKRDFNVYEINYGSKNVFQNTDLVRQKILIENFGANFPIVESKNSNNKVWASYDINSGTNNSGKNVFAYAFEFVDLVTTRDSGVIITSGTQNQDPFLFYRKLQLPEIKTGFDTSFSSYIGYCFNRLECPESKEVEDEVACYTGVSTTGKEYNDFLSGVLKKFASQSPSSEADFASNLVISSGEAISGLFAFQTGEIFYNSFFTGDTITFTLYNFDYTGLYRSYHLNSNPIYPETGFFISYPDDFTDIDSLTSVLNTKLNNISYPVWYPYDCLSGEASGIYITGGLMYFEKNTGISTGDKNYNNIINFRSLRNYQRGFDLKLNLINRDEYLDDLTRQFFRKGFSYLIPNVIELQGLTGGQWLVLDRRSGLYNSLTGLEPTQKSLNAPPELFAEDGEDFLSSSDITGLTADETFPVEEVLFSGGFQTLQKFKQRNFTPAPAYCAQNIYEREISIIQPTGWPVGINPCDPSKPLPEEEQEPSGDGKNQLELFLEVKRTGWYLDPTGIYLNCLTSPDYNLNKVSFSKYRIVAKDFSGLKPSIENQYIIPKNEIYFTNVNLFSLEDSSIGVHTGQAQCLIGANYTVDVEDIIGFPFNTNFQYSITGEDRSGIYRAINQQVIYQPTTGERNIKFVRSSGKIVNNVTGLVNGTFSGSGVVSHTFGNRYYYNPSTNEIYFREVLTGDFLRSGILSGSSIALKDFIVNQEILIGGRLNAGSIYSEIISGGLFTGLLTGVSYIQDNITGLYILTGQVTGLSNSGFFNYNQLVSGVFESNFITTTGSFINFTNIIGMNRISDDIDSGIHIYRDTNGSIFNTGFQSSWSDNDWSDNSGDFFGTPAYTLWNIDGWSNLTGISKNQVTGRSFVSFYSLWGGGQIGNNVVGEEMVMWDTLNNKYYAVKFSEWQAGGGGKFTYDRSLINFNILIDEDNFPYYPIPTGFKQSSGTISINYNKINNFNFVSINNTSINYQSNTGLYFPPDYFSNTDSLVNIINESPSIFNCTGIKLSSTGILLIANDFALGSSGNNITITGNGSGFSFSANTLTGGKTFFPTLFPTSPFSGIANSVGVATGFYYENASGVITGAVPTFTGVRNFTGIWGLQTGSNFNFISFIANNLISGNNTYFSTGIFEDATNFAQILVQYNNQLNTDENNIFDVANLKIKDLNYNLVLPTGSLETTGTFNFRITGIKNL